MILGSIYPDKRSEIFSLLKSLIIECINPFEEVISLINEGFNNEHKITSEENHKYIMKGKIRIKLPEQYHQINHYLTSFFDCLFFTLFVDFKECILFSGPSGYKTFISEKISSKETPIINLYQETSIAQLLGSVIFSNSMNGKKFYLEEILKLCHSSDKLTDL